MGWEGTRYERQDEGRRRGGFLCYGWVGETDERGEWELWEGIAWLRDVGERCGGGGVGCVCAIGWDGHR